MKLHFKFAHLVLACLFFACNPGGGSQNTQNPDSSQIKTVKETEIENIEVPQALNGFDKTYAGLLGTSKIHLNLRKYGNNLSGSYWSLNEPEERTLKGILQEGQDNFILTITDKSGNTLGELVGGLTDTKSLIGKWKSQKGEELTFNLNEVTATEIYDIKVDDLELNQDSHDGKRKLRITYPQLLGIHDQVISARINNEIEHYFEESTLLDSINSSKVEFSEDVKFEVTFLGNELISICKNHHLSKNKGTHIFEDSHGININFKRAKVYELRDLFKPNAIDQLNALIISRINKSCGGLLSKDDLENCKLKAEESTSFSLSKKNQNITFHLTERLPHKYRGCGYVRISFKDLLEYFNPSGPIQEMLQKS